MELNVYKLDGSQSTEKVTLPSDIFEVEPNQHLIYMAVRTYLSNQRQGTRKTKERAEVHGGGKKPFRQKGTGGARAGSIKSPVFVGGGRIFGPRPRDYGFKINKKVKALARKSAFSVKAQSDAISVLEAFTFDAPKTKSYLDVLNSLALVNTKTLLILPAVDSNVYLSSRNISKAKVITVDAVNTYDLMYADRLLISESALSILETQLNK